jgi:ATP-dependent DNA helicase DinG
VTWAEIEPPLDLSAIWPDPDLIPDNPDDGFWWREGGPRRTTDETDSRLSYPWPGKLDAFRPWQIDATREIVDGFRRGMGVMVLDGPPGTGKTIIGEMVMRCRQGGRATYLAHTISLQQQFVEDFPYAAVVKGAANYATEVGPGWVTCADCQGSDCTYCEEACPYKAAKTNAVRGGLAVANTAYWLHEANHVREGLSGRELLVVDECDTLESALMGFVEFGVTSRQLARIGVKPVKKAARTDTVLGWLDEVAGAARGWATTNRKSGDVKVQRDVKTMTRLASSARVFQMELRDGMDVAADDPDADNDRWVRDYARHDDGDVVWKPVTVGRFGGGKVWRHCQQALAMSGTVVSAGEWAESAGVDAAGIEWGSVAIESPFPVAHRPVVIVPAANMTYKTAGEETWKLLIAIRKVLARHPDDRVLIHTTSYKLNGDVVAGLGNGRTIITHSRMDGASGREEALNRYLATPGAVLCSPSMDRGVDLPGDACRVQVVCKVPFGPLGDRQVATRLRVPGGQTWYAVQTARTLIQMTGRGVRSSDDHATTYILDKQFSRWWKEGKRLVPRWWADGVKPGRLTDFQ